MKATEKVCPAAHLTMYVRVSFLFSFFFFFWGSNGIKDAFVFVVSLVGWSLGTDGVDEIVGEINKCVKVVEDHLTYKGRREE